MLLQSEKSEPGESEERRLPFFSWSDAAESSPLGNKGDARVRRGILAES